MIAFRMGAYEVTLGALLVVLAIIVLIAWFGRHDPTRRVRFGFFFERDRYDELDLQDAPPEVRQWLARFFEQYPWKRHVPEEPGSTESPDSAPTESRKTRA